MDFEYKSKHKLLGFNILFSTQHGVEKTNEYSTLVFPR